MGIFNKITAKKIEKMKERKDVSGLIKALKSKEPDIRKLSVSALGSYDIRDSIAVLPLIPLLKDEDLETRKEAATTLGFIRDARAVGPLIEALKDIEPGMRENAASALGSIGDTQALEQLIETLEDVASDVRYFAVSALEELGDKRAVEPLIQIMQNDKNEVIGGAAADALGKINDSRAIGPLFDALKDEKVSYNALMALEKMKDHRVIGLLCKALSGDYNSKLKLWIAEELIRIGDDQAVEPLIHYLKDKDDASYQTLVKVFDTVFHREDWEGKKSEKFDSVYKVIAKRLGIPVDKQPEETIYEGQNVKEVIEKVCTTAIPQTPILTESQINSEYGPIRDAWGTGLYKGTVEDLVKALQSRLKNDSVDKEFSEFSVRIYYTQNCSQVESHFRGTFKGYRIWNTGKKLFFCFST